MNPMKALLEKRDTLQTQLEQLVTAVETENRAMTQEEEATFDQTEAEIRAIDGTVERMERQRALEPKHPQVQDSQEAVEERAFADYILGTVQEQRTGEANLTMTDNGAIIPTSIVNRIIKEVKDRCPILAGATPYNVKGTLKIPVWGDTSTGHNIAVGYQTEFTEITADAGKFTSVDLAGYLAGALTLIGKSLENNGAFDVVSFIVTQMAEDIATWLEGQLLTGTGSSAIEGACNTTNVLTTASSTAITADELIDLQAKVKQAYQKNAVWTMNSTTFTTIKKLKDSNGRYLLQNDVTGAFPHMLLGKPVYLSDNMATIAASATTILYGDYSGLSVNFRENIAIQVLREKYATQHAIGVIAWLEVDAKVSNHQKLAVLKQKAST